MDGQYRSYPDISNRTLPHSDLVAICRQECPQARHLVLASALALLPQRFAQFWDTSSKAIGTEPVHPVFELVILIRKRYSRTMFDSHKQRTL